MGPNMELHAEESGGKTKAVLIAVIVLIFLIAIGAGWYYLYLRPATPEAIPATTPEATTTVVALPPAPVAPAAHTSFFITPADVITGQNIEATATPAMINTLLFTVGSNTIKNTSSTSGMIDIELANLPATDPPYAKFSDYFSRLLPELTAPELAAIFQDDFTTFVYYDNNGIWPGYIAKLNPDASIVPAQELVARLETASSSLKNLFATTPGVISVAGFKDGSVKNRYITFKKAGASVDYGWYNNYFVIGTSFDGFKAALQRLGVTTP